MSYLIFMIQYLLNDLLALIFSYQIRSYFYVLIRHVMAGALVDALGRIRQQRLGQGHDFAHRVGTVAQGLDDAQSGEIAEEVRRAATLAGWLAIAESRCTVWGEE